MRSRGILTWTNAEIAKPSTSAHHTSHAMRKASHSPLPMTSSTAPVLLAAAHEAPDGAHQLAGELVAVAVLAALDDAVAGVVVEQPERDLVERRLDGGDLGDDVD